jgi:hypothetical protein
LPTTSKSATTTLTVSATATTVVKDTVEAPCPPLSPNTVLSLVKNKCTCSFSLYPGRLYEGLPGDDSYGHTSQRPCAEQCASNSHCTHWTYYPQFGLCREFQGLPKDVKPGHGCAVSGKRVNCNAACGTVIWDS